MSEEDEVDFNGILITTIVMNCIIILITIYLIFLTIKSKGFHSYSYGNILILSFVLFLDSTLRLVHISSKSDYEAAHYIQAFLLASLDKYIPLILTGQMFIIYMGIMKTEFYNQHKKESEDFQNIKENYSIMEKNLYETQKKYKVIENKLSESIDDLLKNERKLNDINNKNEVLSKENALIKNQLNYFENAFNNMKRRKEEENNELKKELEEIKEEKEELDKENSNLKSELNEIKSKNRFLQQENDIIKSENENMKKILKEKNDKVKISDEKINSKDNLINLYKKSNEDLNLELDRIKLSRKAEKEESNKIIEEFGKTLKEKDQIFENKTEKLKNKYEQDLNEQIEANESLKIQFIENKMEKDKYKSELDIALEENKSLQNQVEEQKINFNAILKEQEEFYMKQINSLNQRLRANIAERMEENNELNNDNMINDNITNVKLAKKGEEIANELRKENEELKYENEKLKEENQKLKIGRNEINNIKNIGNNLDDEF